MDPTLDCFFCFFFTRLRFEAGWGGVFGFFPKILTLSFLLGIAWWTIHVDQSMQHVQSKVPPVRVAIYVQRSPGHAVSHCDNSLGYIRSLGLLNNTG